MVWRPLLLTLALTWAVAGCGERPASAPPPPPPPRAEEAPSDPGEALDWIRAAQLKPEVELRRRLAVWPLGPGPFFDAEETQVVLTWRLRMALQDGEVEAARAAWETLRGRFEGHGVSPEGRGLTPEMIRGGLREEALLQARLRMDGAAADPKGARSALALAAELLGDDPDAAPEDPARLAAARRWVELTTIVELTQDARVQVPLGPSLASVATTPAAQAHPWILVIADDFALGEEPFTGPLERWQREGAEIGLRVAVIPRFTGQVRMGIRRVPMMDVVRERASVVERLAPRGLALADEMPDGPFHLDGRRDDLGEQCAAFLGLGPQHAAVLVVDARGRIVGRMGGTGLDLRDLDPVVQKLVSR